MTSHKGPGVAPKHDGTPLHIAIIHARWNETMISSLVAGARSSLLAAGVQEQNIITESVPGAYELPLACRGVIAARDRPLEDRPIVPSQLQRRLDAVIAIGVLIKGETMHFEYIADAVSQGLMRVQLDSGVPVVFGLLTVLTEEQGLARAGLSDDGGHNHGVDWGNAAVELGCKRRVWGEGRFSGD